MNEPGNPPPKYAHVYVCVSVCVPLDLDYSELSIWEIRKCIAIDDHQHHYHGWRGWVTRGGRGEGRTDGGQTAEEFHLSLIDGRSTVDTVRALDRRRRRR